jgi:hypothetical protein
MRSRSPRIEKSTQSIGNVCPRKLKHNQDCVYGFPVNSLLFFSTVLVLASLCVITARNPVHAALFLVLAFFTAGGIWMLLHAEFLAIA